MEAPRIIQISLKDRSSVSPVPGPIHTAQGRILTKLHVTRETAQSSVQVCPTSAAPSLTGCPPEPMPEASEALRAQIQGGLLLGKHKIGPLLFSLDTPIFSSLPLCGARMKVTSSRKPSLISPGRVLGSASTLMTLLSHDGYKLQLCRLIYTTGSSQGEATRKELCSSLPFRGCNEAQNTAGAYCTCMEQAQ